MSDRRPSKPNHPNGSSAPSNTVQFGKIPYAMVEAGAIRSLKRNEARVYVAILAHLNNETWTAKPSIPTLAWEAGVCDRTVERAVDRLVDKRLIAVRRRRGRSNCNIYTVATKPDTLGDGFSECQKPVKSAGKPRKPHGKTPSNQAEKPDAQCDARTEEQSEQTNSRAAAADVPEGEALKPAGPDEELRAALTEAGIGGAKRESLARLWSGIDQAPATIREVAARLGERGKGTGAIIRELEHQADAKRACADQDQVRKRVDRERRAAEKAENEQIERERLARNQVIDSLSDEELNHYKGRAVEQAPLPFLGSRYREADPRSHVPLMIEICRLAREDRAASVATDGGQQCDDQTR